MNLTPAQYELARRLARGDTREQVMHDLGITYHTYKAHRRDALRRYGVETTPDLWRALGWLRVPQ